MKIFDAALSDETCVFDNCTFETPRDVVEWASGRGGRYVLQVGIINGKGCPISISTYNGSKWSRYTPWDGWEELTKKDVVEIISDMR